MKRYYIFLNNKVVQEKKGSPILPLGQRQWDELAFLAKDSVILPLEKQSSNYVISLPDEAPLPQGYQCAPLRNLLADADEALYIRYARAAQLIHWHSTRRFCGSCGAPNKLEPEEMAMTCTQCKTLHYPVISPCIITLIHRDREVLLARSPHYPEKLFSTVAGFIEPGEPAELAVAREIFEEVGVKVKNISYFTSQSWPFPGQLMLGFFAEYDGGEITIDNNEICQAGWFSIDALPPVPASWTLAGKLIRHYCSKLNG